MDFINYHTYAVHAHILAAIRFLDLCTVCFYYAVIMPFKSTC